MRSRWGSERSLEIDGDFPAVLGQPDGVVEYGVPLRRALARVVRCHRPEIVITTNFRDTWDGAVVLNQADHRATGWAVLDAVRDAGNRWVFPELLAEGLEPHITPEIYIYGAREADVWVDISDTIDTKVAALLEHRSQVGDEVERITEMMYEWARETAKQHPDRPEGFGEFAESFKYMNLG